MTLDEAIKHTEEVANANERLCETVRPAMQLSDYGKCAEEHRQFAEWLKDYKRLLEQEQKTGHCKDCKWWKDSDGAFRRGIGAESQCPMNRVEGYCYMFEPREQEG